MRGAMLVMKVCMCVCVVESHTTNVRDDAVACCGDEDKETHQEKNRIRVGKAPAAPMVRAWAGVG